jgi:hypothetical protein
VQINTNNLLINPEPAHLMPDCSAGCIGRWNHFGENGVANNRSFPCNASFLGKQFQNRQVQRYLDCVCLPTSFRKPEQSRLAFPTTYSSSGSLHK